jgi:uncharacterized protein YndB with AHSA1/START domain
MTSNDPASVRLLGSLQSEGGEGIVRMEDRLSGDVVDVWSALTDPRRLAGWIGEVDGDLRVGGTFHRRFFASGSEGTGRVEECEPRRRLLVTLDPGQPSQNAIEVTLVADGEETVLVWEERGLPEDKLAAYGAGIQIHVEDLAAHLAGRDHCDADARWDELEPAYQALMVKGP